MANFKSPLPANALPLRPAAFRALSLGAVRPAGWLLAQLQVQAAGLSGHLDEFWPDVGPDSGWLGGAGEAWERGPYFLDGLLPLAHLLDDARLKAKAKPWVDWTLEHVQPGGQIGPKSNVDWWPRMVMLKVLTQHFEATGDARVLPVLQQYCRYQLAALPARPLDSWAFARGGDNILTVQWLYNFVPAPELLDLANLLALQTADWAGLQAGGGVDALVPRREFGMLTHVVNNAMGIKAPAVGYLQSGLESLRQAPRRGIEHLMRAHGQPNGIWSGDEHLSGTAPTQGTELCAVAEYMFSLEESLRIVGDPFLGDRLEQVAYNALPATFKPDMWAHQYDQQVNQVLASVAQRNWANNGDWSNVYGLEPNFGCCTANLHQAWPKFVKSLVMATPDGGPALLAYGPCVAELALPDGAQLRLVEETDYPFQETVEVHLQLSQPSRFALTLRIPAWATQAELTVNGAPEPAPQAGTFAHVERSWQDGDRLSLRLPMGVRVTAGHAGLLSVYRGPLLFGLKIGEDWQQIGGVAPHADWEVHPTTPWNYALAVDTGNVTSSFNFTSGPVSATPFAPDAAPVSLRARGRQLPEWGLVQNSAGPISGGPHVSSQPETELNLIPYGSTNLRIAAFPFLATQ